jgi:diguanylate cyclase (GGDEF)-like protein/PAS domain S-box-containing protein
MALQQPTAARAAAGAVPDPEAGSAGVVVLASRKEPRRELADLVARAGHVVQTAGSVAEVLEIDTHEVDVVLAADAAPALVEALRERRAALRPLVLALAPRGSAALRRALDAGVDDLLPEPWKPGDLEQRLALVARRALHRRESYREVALMRHLEKALEMMPLGVTVTDPGHRVLYANPADAAMHGLPVAEMVGRDSRELALRFAVGPGRGRFERRTGEAVDRRCDGTPFPVQVTTVVVPDAEGQPEAIVTCREDISERKRAELALRISEERYALAARGSHDGLWDWNLQTDRIYLSERWKQILGFGPKQLGDRPAEWLERVHPADRERLQSALERHLAGTARHFECSHRLLHERGEFLWVLARGLAVPGADGRPYRMAGSLTDLSERGVHDELTGLPNRRLFAERLRLAEARRSRRPELGYAVLLIDLDRFKRFNEGLSFALGDRLLAEVSERLERSARSVDAVARAGGDEFLLLVEDLSRPAHAVRAAERIQGALQEAFVLDGREVFATASVGIAWCGEGTHAQDPIRDAGIALHRAKLAGGNRVQVFDPGMQERANARLVIEGELRRALEREELRAAYQPILDLDTGRLSGCEALVRWHHPERGIVFPGAFVPLAEEAGLVVSLDRWMLEEACSQLMRWEEQHGPQPGLLVSVNLSSHHLAKGDVVERVRRCLERTGCPGTRVKLEITESSLMENPRFAARALGSLRELGIRICVDDFGTGYSSLSYLHRFPIDVIKIDRSFVAELSTGGKQPAIVSAIVSLAGHLGMQVVAEGIETGEQLELLRGIGCGFGQGYLFSRPVSPDQAHGWFGAEPAWMATLRRA